MYSLPMLSRKPYKRTAYTKSHVISKAWLSPSYHLYQCFISLSRCFQASDVTSRTPPPAWAGNWTRVARRWDDAGVRDLSILLEHLSPGAELKTILPPMLLGPMLPTLARLSFCQTGLTGLPFKSWLCFALLFSFLLLKMAWVTQTRTFAKG